VSRRLFAVLCLAGAGIIAAAAGLVLFAHGFQPYPPGESLAQVATDAIWIASGIAAWRRRPDNRVGPLMTALGAVDLTRQLYWDAPLPFALASVVTNLTIPVAVHLFLAFPGGRLESRGHRRFVALIYVAVVALAPVTQLVEDPRTTGCPLCPENPVLVPGLRPAAGAIHVTAAVVTAVVLLVTALLLIRRVRGATGPTRRALAPVLLSSAVAVLLLLAVGLVDATGHDVEGGLLLWVAVAAFAAIPIAFLVGLLNVRLRRSAVADLVVELGSAAEPALLRDAVARALRDPSLELAFWLPDRDRYVGPGGEPVDPYAVPGRAVTVLDRDGRRQAALVHDPALLQDPHLVRAVGAAAGLALENARLQAELRAQLAEVRASRTRIIEAGDAERRRLERDLHDGAQQHLLGVRLALRLAQGRLGAEGGATDLLAEADAEVVDALEELRALARGLHPAILAEGLAAAIAAAARRSPVPVELTVHPGRLPAPVEATAYFVAAEALANIAKHARATHATVAVTRADGRLRVEVRDDGVGGADPDGAGLRGLRDRVEALDGRLSVHTPTGGGTRITAEVPCG
jgi:signal transduction histidine kinase